MTNRVNHDNHAIRVNGYIRDGIDGTVHLYATVSPIIGNPRARARQNSLAVSCIGTMT